MFLQYVHYLNSSYQNTIDLLLIMISIKMIMISTISLVQIDFNKQQDQRFQHYNVLKHAPCCTLSIPCTSSKHTHIDKMIRKMYSLHIYIWHLFANHLNSYYVILFFPHAAIWLLCLTNIWQLGFFIVPVSSMFKLKIGDFVSRPLMERHSLSMWKCCETKVWARFVVLVLRPTRETSAHMEMSPWPVKGFKIWSIFGTHGQWAVRIKTPLQNNIRIYLERQLL